MKHFHDLWWFNFIIMKNVSNVNMMTFHDIWFIFGDLWWFFMIIFHDKSGDLSWLTMIYHDWLWQITIQLGEAPSANLPLLWWYPAGNYDANGGLQSGLSGPIIQYFQSHFRLISSPNQCVILPNIYMYSIPSPLDRGDHKILPVNFAQFCSPPPLP